MKDIKYIDKDRNEYTLEYKCKNNKDIFTFYVNQEQCGSIDLYLNETMIVLDSSKALHILIYIFLKEFKKAGLSSYSKYIHNNEFWMIVFKI